MDYTLIGELQGLLAAKDLLEKRIEEIQRAVSGNLSAPKEFSPLPNDPTILGRDSLGRIKRKRNISPEVRAKKVALINQARQARLNKIRAEVLAENETAASNRQVTASTTGKETGPKKAGPHLKQ